MDLKTHILRWERPIGDNPAVLFLAIIGSITTVFVVILVIEGYLTKRKRNKRRRG